MLRGAGLIAVMLAVSMSGELGPSFAPASASVKRGWGTLRGGRSGALVAELCSVAVMVSPRLPAHRWW